MTILSIIYVGSFWFGLVWIFFVGGGVSFACEDLFFVNFQISYVSANFDENN